jgi:hypothetical protein
MTNTLQDTINYVVPYCRYMPANIGTNGMPFIGIANIVRNLILSAPFTWPFNRNFDDSITTVISQQDYPTSILDFGFLEQTTVQDTDGKLYELKDIQNTVSLAKSSTQARPEVISVQRFGVTPLTPNLNSVIKTSFSSSNFTGQTTFSFTVPQTILAGDTLVFGLDMSDGVGNPTSVSDNLGNVITLVSSQNASFPGSDPVATKLGTAAAYAILAAAGITNSGATLITGGNIGSFPTATETGFTGANFTPPAAINNTGASAALTDALTAYNFYSALSFTSLSGSSANLSVLGNGSNASTYIPGNYSAGTSMDIPTSITLDAQGNSNAMFVFKAGSTLTLESGASILLVNGARAENVVWLVGSSATTVGTIGVFNGNILANTSITLGGGTFNGRALAGIVTSSGAVTIATAVTLTVATVPSVVDDHQFVVYNMPVTASGTSVITITGPGPRNFLVQGALLTGVGPIQLTFPVNSQGTGSSWSSTSIVTPLDNEVLISFTTGYAPPATATAPFSLLQSGTIADSALVNVQLSTAALLASTAGTYSSSWTQASSAEWQAVLVGYPTLPGLGNVSPIFRFSAVPNKIFPVNLIYQKKPVQFTAVTDSWSPIPDSFSDIYNNLCLGYYMDSCQDPRAPQYIARGVAGLLGKTEGLTQMDRVAFMASYMNVNAQQLINQIQTQQGEAARGRG